jgi:hypothetical protein
MIEGVSYPLGQITTDILNLDEQVLQDTENRIAVFLSEARFFLEQQKDSAVFPMQEKQNTVWDVVFTLPFYRELPMDEHAARNLFLMLLSDREKWHETLTEGTEGNKMMCEFISRPEYFPESLRNFRGQVSGMLDLYFEQLLRRSGAAYAAAYSRYFRDMVSAGPLFFKEADFEQSFSVQLKFTPLHHPSDIETPILGEELEFSALSHFLYTDFYRGLIVGNAPRRCHNREAIFC